MMISLETARDNIRNRDGKRVYFLAAGDQLSWQARDYLRREGIEVRQPEENRAYRLENGAVLREKPEELTHLHGNVLIPKTHPRIRFRGAMDTMEAELLLAQAGLEGEFARITGEILETGRQVIRSEVLEQPQEGTGLCGLSWEEVRGRSHQPQKYYGQAHFMPRASDGEAMLRLNRARCAVREAELAAAEAFSDREGNLTRPDLVKALNRMSSMVWILMIRLKGGG